MKTLYIIGSGQLGGAETFVHQFSVVHQTIRPTDELAILYAKRQGKLCIDHPIKQYDGSKYISISNFKQLFLLFCQYDLLFFHGLYPLFMVTAFFTNSKIVYFMHGARTLRKSIAKVSGQMLKASYLPTGKSFRRFLRLLFFQFFLKFRCEHVFVPSHYYKIFAQKKYKVNSEKIKILPLGIDLDRFAGSKQDTKKSFSSKKIQIGCVASLRRVKRIDRLIRAIGYLDTDDRNNLSVWIVGDGAEKEHLQGLTTDLGLDKHIDFIPERKNLSPYYSKMDLFILPSKSESFSLVLLEAMYFSIPIIVFKGSGGAEELVNKTGCGIVVEDEKKLARICSKLIHNPDLLQTLCEKSSEIVKQSYTIKAVVKNFLNQLDVK